MGNTKNPQNYAYRFGENCLTNHLVTNLDLITLKNSFNVWCDSCEQ